MSDLIGQQLRTFARIEEEFFPREVTMPGELDDKPSEPTESLDALYIPAFDLHTDLPNVLEWIDHLLGEHDCDHLGYESVMASRDRLRAWSQALRSEQDK